MHDPRYLIAWELWYHSELRSCRVSCTNNTVGEFTVYGLSFRVLSLKFRVQGLGSKF